MKKTKIIKEIVGKRLEPYGFHYLKTDGPCRIFEREIKEIKRYYDPDDVVKQYINVQENHFSKSLVVRLSTNVYGYETECELEQVKLYSTSAWIEYTDEEDYKEKLNLLADLIIQYAFGLLDEMSVEEKIIPTKAMAEQLFAQYEQLDHGFITEFHINAKPATIADVEEWDRIIKEVLVDKVELPYDEVKELLTKLAAFIGERACDLFSQKWIFPEHFKTPAVTGGSYYKFFPLDEVIEMWKFKCDVKFYHEFIDAIKQAVK